ncbi:MULTISPECIES: hypothetical protein [Aeromonas]|uniref:hypothetical protein n=1 Tax=Aeromonas TaxID=642 RepID=UPI0022E1DA2F|nr:hypothetical protein [Aeromonas sp. Y318-1]
MKILKYKEMRALYLKSDDVKNIIDTGFTSTMTILNPKTINDKKVNENSFLVNDDFEINPECFSAFYTDRIFKVIRCIYVAVPSRGKGLAKLMISEFQKNFIFGNEKFLQIGVEYTNNINFTNLERLYSSQSFKRTATPARHPGNKYFHDFFWSPRNFEIIQRNGQVIPEIR